MAMTTYSGMTVEIVDRWSEFDGLAAAWNKLYKTDTQAHLFNSWQWLRTGFELSPNEWCILLARQSDRSTPVGFLPLTSSTTSWRKIGSMHSLRLGGKPFAEYTGFVCHPDHEQGVLDAFAHLLQHDFRWEHFKLEDVVDPRLEYFLDCFRDSAYSVIERSEVKCPQLTLAPSWEEYLKSSLSREPRRTLRKTMRKFRALDGFRVTHAATTDVTHHINSLLGMWQLRHGKDDAAVKRYHRFLLEAHATNTLWLDMAWSHETPVAGIASFFDRVKKILYTFLTAYNPQYGKISPGLAMFGEVIKKAIDHKVETLDFLRGAPEYKTSRLGGRSRRAVSAVIKHKHHRVHSVRNRVGRKSVYER